MLGLCRGRWRRRGIGRRTMRDGLRFAEQAASVRAFSWFGETQTVLELSRLFAGPAWQYSGDIDPPSVSPSVPLLSAPFPGPPGDEAARRPPTTPCRTGPAPRAPPQRCAPSPLGRKKMGTGSSPPRGPGSRGPFPNRHQDAVGGEARARIRTRVRVRTSAPGLSARARARVAPRLRARRGLAFPTGAGADHLIRRSASAGGSFGDRR